MLRDLDKPDKSELLQWIESSAKTKSNILASGYQGHVYLYQNAGQRLVIKTTGGWGPAKIIHRLLLYREYRIYRELAEMQGVPLCYGLLNGRYLVLQYIDGVPLRGAVIADRNVFFEKLLQLIKAMHKAGVAHGDLKKKDNVLVVAGNTPFIIDLGVAVVSKQGFAPLNHFFYKLAQNFDYNAWVKLKYEYKTRDLLGGSKEYYSRTIIERLARWCKRPYRKLKKKLHAYRKRHPYF
jgi:predicted Ser/Thr protein kinase